MHDTPTSSDADSMLNALAADTHDPLMTESLQLFGQFVGAWDLTWSGSNREGRPITVGGELHVGWVLGGRAVQDVWRVPLDPADAPRMRGFHGTTIRFYDPQIEAWRSIWVDPLNGRVRAFIGRPVGDTIVLNTDDDAPPEQWIFSEITPESFHWSGQSSTDGGRTWVTEDQMVGRRRPS